MEVNCQYYVNVGYACVVDSQQIPENVELRFIGVHEDGKTDDDIIEIWFKDCKIPKIPQGLTKIFPNLEILKIRSSNLKSISKAELVEYKNCKVIDFYYNKIDFLPGDLFEDFRNLESVIFEGNTLSSVEPNILDSLEKLKIANLNGDVQYGTLNLGNDVSNWNYYLNLVRNNILDKMIQNENKQILKDFIFGLQFKIETMRKVNRRSMQELEQKNQNLEQDNARLNEENQILQNENVNFNEQNRNFNHENQLLRNNEEGLNHEIQDLKDQQEQSAQEIIQHHQRNFELIQKIVDLEAEFEAKIIENQQNVENFCADINAFIQDDTNKDFQITIDDHEFPVHKFLLAARSPTLAELLKNNPEVENLNLVDISIETFEIILKFLYTDELPGDDETNFLHLFAAAGKLKIEKIKKFSAQKLLLKVEAENALELLNLSNKYGHDELKKAAYEEIKKNYPKMVLSDEIVENGEKVEKLVVIIKKIEEMEKCVGGLIE
ncbi:hypothetical protein ACKWTF_015232 [Chironomus riparius]